MSDLSKAEKEERATKNILAAVMSEEVDMKKRMSKLNATPKQIQKTGNLTFAAVSVLEILSRIKYTLYYIKIAIKDTTSLMRHLKYLKPNHEDDLHRLRKEADRILKEINVYTYYWRSIRDSSKIPFNPWNRYSNKEVSEVVRTIFNKDAAIAASLFQLVHEVHTAFTKKYLLSDVTKH